jgi:asparagine synthase (glutamine-hydrolysing)
MCGIVGVINFLDRDLLDRITDIQSHRGPDDRGTWEHITTDGSSISLGSRRLAILDLSPAGHMPMSTVDGLLTIAYNGEIYNYPQLRKELEAKGYEFKSNSDTEAILYLYQEYGSESVKRLNGMFAISIADIRPDTLAKSTTGAGELFLARDHFGIKPLYYHQQGNRFAFASELKSLLQLPYIDRKIDLNSLYQYLTFLWVPEPNTFLEGIHKLPAGHYATFQDGKLAVTQYWNLNYPDADFSFDTGLSNQDLVTELRQRFMDSVRSQMLSDVPVGAFLSAGLDSSSIVAAMRQATDQQIKTYTISFPKKYQVGEVTLDDTEVAKRTADHFGCEHTEIVVEPKVADLLPKLLWHMDEPIADPAIIAAFLVCEAAKSEVKVLLSGVGGDEIFAGYRKYQAHYLGAKYRKIPSWIRQNCIKPLVSSLPNLRGTPFKGQIRLAKKMLRSADMPPQEAFITNSVYLNRLQIESLLCDSLKAQMEGLRQDPWSQHRKHFDAVSHADFLNQMLYLDTKTFMPSLNFTYNDKMSMASSVEVRVPFLDWELADWVASNVPPDLKINNQTTKYILREAMAPFLPTEVLQQKKASFGAPIDYWLANDLREMVDDLLSSERIIKRGLFNPMAVNQLIEEHRSDRQDNSFPIWQLITLELWMQQFID